MNGKSYTKEATDVIKYSKEEAARTDAACIKPEHILLGIIRNEESNAAKIICSLYADLKKIRKELEERLVNDNINLPKTELKDLNFDEQSTRVLRLCFLESKLEDKDSMGSEHILLGIMKEEKNNAAQILKQNNITYEKIKGRISDTTTPVPTSGLNFDESEEDDGIERRDGNRFGSNDSFHHSGNDYTSQTKKGKPDNGDKNLVTVERQNQNWQQTIDEPKNKQTKESTETNNQSTQKTHKK